MAYRGRGILLMLGVEVPGFASGDLAPPLRVQRPEITDSDVLRYEGLVSKTASMYVPYVQETYEDIRQMLRLKVWQSLQAYDPAASRMTQDRYVFMCLKNRCKDLLRVRRREEVLLSAFPDPEELFAGDTALLSEARMNANSLARRVDQREEVDTEHLDLDLDEQQRTIAAMLVEGYKRTEIAEHLGVPIRRVYAAIEVMREALRPVAA